MIHAVLFDLDNTLIDFTAFKERTARAAAKAMVAQGAPVDENEAYRLIYDVYGHYGPEYEKTYSGVVKSFNLKDLNQTERIQQAAIVAHQTEMPKAFNPYPMVKHVLKELKRRGIKIAVVSDAPRNKAWKRLVMAGLGNEFDAVVTHSDTGTFKPDKKHFEIAIEQLGITADACLFVGDNPGKDIRGAKEMGMYTCLAKYGLWDHTDQIKPDYEIDRFSDLLGVIAVIDQKIKKELLDKPIFKRSMQTLVRIVLPLRTAREKLARITNKANG